jgi:type II secretory pathway component PulF
MKFAYEACDISGKTSADVVETGDESAAADILRQRGLFVTAIRPADGAGGRAAAGGRSLRMGTGKRLKNLAMFTRQLSVLVTSGTPLVQSLGALERQAKDPVWRQILAGVRAKVEEGLTLSQAMESFPQAFDPVCRSLIAAGESGGSFDVMLDRLAMLARRQMQVRSAIVGAMVYPALLVVVAFGVLGLMLLFVLPRFATLFETLDVALPPLTRFMLALSSLLQNYWWALLLGAGAASFGIKYWLGTPGGRRSVDTLMLNVPLAGKVFKSFAMARIARVLGVLVTGKVPLLEALGLTRQTARNVNYVELVASAEESVTRGSSVSAAFGATKLVDPSLVEAIKSGEQSGQIGPLLLSIADFLDEDNEVVIKSLTSIIEPIILVALGVVVGFVAMSMFLPLFDLTSAAHA